MSMLGKTVLDSYKGEVCKRGKMCLEVVKLKSTNTRTNLDADTALPT